jgi:hypothetical protein
LQELGKASGILLLPPGAMDKLLVSRHAAEPTIAYTPPSLTARKRRRVLIGVTILLVLLGLSALVYALFFKTRLMDPHHGSLLGVRIDDAQQEVVERLKLVKGGPMNPWATEKMPGYLGHVLRAEDLGLPAEALPRLDVQRTEDDKVCIVFHEDRVRAVVARRPQAGTERGLKVLDRKGRVLDIYPEDVSLDFSIEAANSPRATRKIEVRRYDSLGIGFEMHEGKVIAITLYPPVGNP